MTPLVQGNTSTCHCDDLLGQDLITLLKSVVTPLIQVFKSSGEVQSNLFFLTITQPVCALDQQPSAVSSSLASLESVS